MRHASAILIGALLALVTAWGDVTGQAPPPPNVTVTCPPQGSGNPPDAGDPYLSSVIYTSPVGDWVLKRFEVIVQGTGGEHVLKDKQGTFPAGQIHLNAATIPSTRPTGLSAGSYFLRIRLTFEATGTPPYEHIVIWTHPDHGSPPTNPITGW